MGAKGSHQVRCPISGSIDRAPKVQRRTSVQTGGAMIRNPKNTNTGIYMGQNNDLKTRPHDQTNDAAKTITLTDTMELLMELNTACSSLMVVSSLLRTCHAIKRRTRAKCVRPRDALCQGRRGGEDVKAFSSQAENGRWCKNVATLKRFRHTWTIWVCPVRNNVCNFVQGPFRTVVHGSSWNTKSWAWSTVATWGKSGLVTPSSGGKESSRTDRCSAVVYEFFRTRLLISIVPLVPFIACNRRPTMCGDICFGARSKETRCRKILEENIIPSTYLVIIFDKRVLQALTS